MLVRSLAGRAVPPVAMAIAGAAVGAVFLTSAGITAALVVTMVAVVAFRMLGSPSAAPPFVAGVAVALALAILVAPPECGGAPRGPAGECNYELLT